MARRPRPRKPKLTVVPDDAAMLADLPEPEVPEEVKRARARNDELLDDAEISKQVADVVSAVQEGFQAQWDRGNDQMDWWDIYDCVLGAKQGYAGNAQIYLPIVRTAVNARNTRFVNQVFPRAGRNVDCITSDEKPYAVMSLMEHYIRSCKLRTQVVPGLFRNGDIEGQYNLYISWRETERQVVTRTPGQINLGRPDPEAELGAEASPDADDIDLTIDDEGDPDGDVAEQEVIDARPDVEVLADVDVLILPVTAKSVGDALHRGGSATVIRRWSKEELQKKIDSKEIQKAAGGVLIGELSATDDPNTPSVVKKHVDAAGVNSRDGRKELVVYETWTMLKIDGETRLCRMYYGGGEKDTTLSVKRCPYWNDRCPILSAPLEKIAGVFKGQSKVYPVAGLQYAANDTVNEGLDSAAYALMPIVMTDPAKNPRVGSMILNLAAIWETDPKSTQFAQFPQLWKDAMTLVSQLKTEVWQGLSVSPAALVQSTGSDSKRNQAEIANEQQVEMLSTADVCTNAEDEILTPLLRWFVELDYQYRDRPITVRQYGEMGLQVNMEDIPPLQSNTRYEFRWFGIEQTRNAQMLQQQIATMNVIRGIPPQQYQGYEFNAVPIISALVDSTFGSRLTPEIFKNLKAKLSLEPQMENQFLSEGLTLPVHELDDDQQHMQVHLQALQAGDPTGSVRQHLMNHNMQMQKKLAMQVASVQSMQAQGANGMPQQPIGGGPPGAGSPGVPGGAGPGVAGTPRMGAQPGQVRNGQMPAGAVHHDRLRDPAAAPRR